MAYRTRSPLARVIGFAIGATAACLVVVACSSPNPAADLSGRDAGPPGLSGDAASFPYTKSSAVTGAADTHCGATTVQSTNPASCTPNPATLDGSAGGTYYGPPMYGSSGSDDNCKYDVSWQSTATAVGQGVWFEITAKKRTDGSPLTGAAPLVEVFRTATGDPGPATNAKQTATEVSPGVYVVGPIVFDQATTSGGSSSAPPYWTARFHFFESCTDLLPDTPHGHAAFYVQVPSP